MRGMKLIDFRENLTTKNQINRGKSQTGRLSSESFIESNRISLDITYIFDSPEKTSICKKDLEDHIPNVMEAHKMLKNEEGDICDGSIPMTGWQNLPEEISQDHLEEIKSITNNLGKEIDAFVSLGIGGSYLGIEATFRALTHNYFNQLTRENRGGAPEIYFLGQNMDPDYFRDTLDMLEGKRIGINVISKSGTTTETAIAFRILQKLIEKNWKAQAKDLILITTDKVKGALKGLADKKDYSTFVVPDNVGGRYSVLTDVGLVGLAMANIDIIEFVAGFKNMRRISLSDNFWENPCLIHAAVRDLAWKIGKKIEVVATNSNSLYFVSKWMEQLFPESEGHNGKGLWVSPSLYSEKLHANGQMVQDGERNIIETFLALKDHDNSIKIPHDNNNLDGLNFLSDRGLDMNFINQKVIDGPAYAHYLGGVPNMTIKIPKRNAYNLGQLYFMLERSVAISGFLLGHNPFIQPGVESYKKAIFALIGKPGYEKKSIEMRKNIKKMERIIIHG